MHIFIYIYSFQGFLSLCSLLQVDSGISQVCIHSFLFTNPPFSSFHPYTALHILGRHRANVIPAGTLFSGSEAISRVGDRGSSLIPKAK